MTDRPYPSSYSLSPSFYYHHEAENVVDKLRRENNELSAEIPVLYLPNPTCFMLSLLPLSRRLLSQ